MPAAEALMTVAEAAVAAGVETRVVNDVIDRRIVPEKLLYCVEGARRLVAPEACFFIILYKSAGESLSSEFRSKIIHKLSERISVNEQVLVSRREFARLFSKRAVASDLTIHSGGKKSPTKGKSFQVHEKYTWSGALTHIDKKALLIKEGVLTVNLHAVMKEAKKGLSELEKAVLMVTVDANVMGGMACIRDTRIPVYDVAALVRAKVPTNEILEDYPDLSSRDLELAEIYALAHPPKGRPPTVREVFPGAKLRAKRVVKRHSATAA